MKIKCKNRLCGKSLKGKYSSLGKCKECGSVVCRICKDWKNKKELKHVRNMCSSFIHPK